MKGLRTTPNNSSNVLRPSKNQSTKLSTEASSDKSKVNQSFNKPSSLVCGGSKVSCQTPTRPTKDCTVYDISKNSAQTFKFKIGLSQQQQLSRKPQSSTFASKINSNVAATSKSTSKPTSKNLKQLPNINKRKKKNIKVIKTATEQND